MKKKKEHKIIKVEVEGKKKRVAPFLGLPVIVALILLLLHFKGFGIPGLNDKDGKEKNDTSISEKVDKNEPTESGEDTKDNNEEALKISVQKNEIIIDNSIIEVNDIEKAVSGKDNSIQIIIEIDDTAAKNTVDELTDKLDELGYKNYKKTDK